MNTAIGSTLTAAAVLAILAGGALAAIWPDTGTGTIGWLACASGAALGALGHRIRTGGID